MPRKTHDAEGDERAWCGATRAPQASHPAVAGSPAGRAQPVSGKSSPRSSRKRRTEASWWSRRSAMRRACSAAQRGEVLEAALGVVGQRIDVRDVLLGAGDAHRRAALGQRARAAHRRHGDVLLGRDEGDRHEAVGRAGAPARSTERSTPTGASAMSPAAARARWRARCRPPAARRAARGPARRRPPRPRRGCRRRRGRGRTGRAAARRRRSRCPRRADRARRRSGSSPGRRARGRRRSARRDSARPPTRMATATDASGSMSARRSSSSASSPAGPCCSSIVPPSVPAIRGAKAAPPGYP